MPTTVPVPAAADAIARLTLGMESVRAEQIGVNIPIVCACPCFDGETGAPALYGSMSYPPSTCFGDD